MKRFVISVIFLTLIGSSVAQDKPNIIYIMLDEWGYYESSHMGHPVFDTPNIDRLAKEGMRFTRFLAGANVCAPTRSALMTGQHTGHTTVRGNSGGNSILDSDVTIAEMLKAEGYATGGFGKWGLGDAGTEGVPEKQGFDTFLGYYHQVHAHTFYPRYLLRNSEKVYLEGNTGDYHSGETFAQDLIHREALNFIQANSDRPFFAYLPYTPPHGQWMMPHDDPAWMKYKDVDWDASDQRGKGDAKYYAAMLEMTDRHIGELLALLKELEIENNTIIFLCGDNGGAPYFADEKYPYGFFGPNVDPKTGKVFRGGKGDFYEGGLRIPFIVHWPGRIKPNSESDHLGYFPDVMPTLAELAGIAPPESTDGISIVPTLVGKKEAGRHQENHEYLYWEDTRGSVAVTQDIWKAVKYRKGEFELYNLKKDVEEQNDLAEAHPDILDRLLKHAEEAHTPDINGRVLDASLGFKGHMNAPVDFATGGNNVRNIVAAKINGEPVLYISELTGSIACYNLNGEKRWEYKIDNPAVTFEILAEDIDGDGSDELLAASGGGTIYCWNGDGTLRWDFKPDHRVRFSEVAVFKNGSEARVFAGGNDTILYELGSDGNLISRTPIDGTVRKIETGYFIDKETPSIFLMTYTHDKYRWNFFGFLDPFDKHVQRSIDHTEIHSIDMDRLMFNDMYIEDVDQDGLDDILIFASGYQAGATAVVMAFNGDFEMISRFLGPQEDQQRYAHVIGTALFPARDEIVAQYGGIWYIFDRKGNLIQRIGEPYGPNALHDMCFEPVTGCLIAAGDVSGGNEVYAFQLEKTDWWNKEREIIGRRLTVKQNLDTLYKQALDFTPPAYQNPSDKPWVMITSAKPSEKVRRLKGNEIRFIHQESWSEDFDRSHILAITGEIGDRRDRRKPYKSKRSELIARAAEFEKNNQPFVIWAGHGNDPFYVAIETLEGVLEAAPETCHGFLFAEMANPDDPRIQYFLEHIIPRLVTACRKNGKAKLYFRYKSMFWSGTSHLEPWKSIFFSGKYNDVLVPSTEDTNSRLMDLNLTGRVGMFKAGYVDDFAMRLVDDNPTAWRPLAPGGQSSVSPYLRSGVIRAAYGARYGILFNNAFLEEPGLDILYALMASGALPVVKKDMIASVGSWHLIRDADKELIHSSDDGHNLDRYNRDDVNAVFSLAQVEWAGTDLPDYDFSRQVLGVDNRWLNFMPQLPYGMVPIVPGDYKDQLMEEDVPFSVSTGKKGFLNGKLVPAADFAAELKKIASEGVDRLPVVVEGASWCAIRLDETHIRVILIDPGYVESRDRVATLRFQGKMPETATDILRNEHLDTSRDQLKLWIPAGSMRFIDISY